MPCVGPSLNCLVVWQESFGLAPSQSSSIESRSQEERRPDCAAAGASVALCVLCVFLSRLQPRVNCGGVTNGVVAMVVASSWTWCLSLCCSLVGGSVSPAARGMAAMHWDWETPSEGSETSADRDSGYGAVGVGLPHMARDPPPEPSQAPASEFGAERPAVSVCRIGVLFVRRLRRRVPRAAACRRCVLCSALRRRRLSEELGAPLCL